jgi:hypothetical protein
VGQALVPDVNSNGGFPEPPTGEPVRVVAARHEGCAEATRVRLPQAIPARAVRRVRCAECEREFDAERVEELSAPPRRPRLGAIVDRIDPASPGWRLASVVLAAAAVIGGLILIQGGGDEPAPNAPPATGAETAPPGGEGQRGGEESVGGGGQAGNAKADVSKHTTLVEGSSYRLALPAGWEQVNPPSGATFKAVAPDGDADATLWINRDRNFDFDQFVTDSTSQLEALAGTKPIEVERVIAPSLEDSVVRLAADTPPGQPSYEVTLRAADEYRYHLAVSVQPDASRETVAGADLIAESLAPAGSG